MPISNPAWACPYAPLRAILISSLCKSFKKHVFRSYVSEHSIYCASKWSWWVALLKNGGTDSNDSFIRIFLFLSTCSFCFPCHFFLPRWLLLICDFSLQRKSFLWPILPNVREEVLCNVDLKGQCVRAAVRQILSFPSAFEQYLLDSVISNCAMNATLHTSEKLWWPDAACNTHYPTHPSLKCVTMSSPSRETTFSSSEVTFREINYK